MKKILSPRPKDSNKYDFGHILVVAGSRGMTGAAVLTSVSALRAGAGLVTLACPLSLQPIFSKKLTEVMTLGLPETSSRPFSPTDTEARKGLKCRLPGTSGSGLLSIKAYKEILNFIEKRRVNVLAIGPGLSTHNDTVKLILKIVGTVNKPIVLDADGINALQGHMAILQNSKGKIIITPHTGELGRLIGKSSREIQKNRIYYAKNFAKENNVICVLKGYKTIVTDGRKTFINPTGNSGMATAGSGDVLTGMIAGFLGQGIPEFDSAKLGVYIHGLAGDLAVKEKTEQCMIASDIIEKIPDAIKKNRRIRTY